MKRKPYKPQIGEIYQNHGGGEFICRKSWRIGQETRARMENTRSSWSFEARDVRIYEDGSIDWAYSVGGKFADEEKAREYARRAGR